MLKILLPGIIFFLISSGAQALISPRHGAMEKVGHYLSEGMFVGGKQGRDLSLLNLNWVRAKAKPAERVELVLGEANGRKLSGPLAYYHVAIEKNPARIVIDLAQVQRTAIDEKAISERLAKSQFIAGTDFTMDPEDLSTNLTLRLRKPLSVEVFERADDGVLVLDIKDSKNP